MLSKIIYSRVGLDTELHTFKGTDWIGSVLPSTDWHEIIRYQISVPENAFGHAYEREREREREGEYLGTHTRERERETDRPCDKSPLQLFKMQHTGQTEMFWSVLTFLGSYGFLEGRMAESIQKNGIYAMVQNATEFVNFWMNKRRAIT